MNKLPISLDWETTLLLMRAYPTEMSEIGYLESAAFKVNAVSLDSNIRNRHNCLFRESGFKKTLGTEQVNI